MTEPVPEFSRPISVARIPPDGVEETLEAKPAERAALAKRFDLLELRSLKAHLTIQPKSHQAFAVTGRVKADVVQRCVVTLDPVAAHIDVSVATDFVPAEQHREGAGSPYPDEGEDEYDVFSGGKIDLGEMAAQYLGVNLDPYPRKADATLTATEFGANVEKPRPLAQLAKAVKQRKKQGETEE